VQTLSVSGKLDAGTGDSVARSIVMARGGAGASVKRLSAAALAAQAAKPAQPPQVQLPFRLEMKRPGKSRLEIDFAGKTAVQVFDGERGWKFRPYLNRDDVEPFTADEAKGEAGGADLEDPLFDYGAKGSQVALDAMEPVDGHKAYRLKVTRRGGAVQNIWIDAQSFLDVKVQGTARRMDGRMHDVFVYQRDFKSVKGLMVPHQLITVVDGYPGTHKMMVESVTVNAPLDDARFAKPQVLVAATAAPTTAASAASPAAK
jgi:hypothetical protein